MSELHRNSWLRNYFENENVFIIGGGPSLCGFDFERLRGKKIIVINHSWEILYKLNIPFDILCFLDSRFISEFHSHGGDFNSLNCKIITRNSQVYGRHDNIFYFYIIEQVSNSIDKLYGSYSSSLIAINAALIGNAKNIYLLGVDQKFHNKKHHFFSEEWKKLGRNHAAEKFEYKYKNMVKRFLLFEKYKNIFNCSPISAVKCFPYENIDEVLK